MNERQLVHNWYAALGRADLDAVLAAFDPEIEWREAEGHPYQAGGEPWHGAEAIRDNLILRLASEWDGFTVTPARFHDAGDTVVVEGRYTGTFEPTRRHLDAQFCHIWRVRNGRLAGFQQYVDTAELRRVTDQSAGGGEPSFAEASGSTLGR